MSKRHFTKKQLEKRLGRKIFEDEYIVDIRSLENKAINKKKVK